MAPPGEELRNQKTPSPPSEPRNGVGEQMPEVRVPVSHLFLEDGATNTGGASTFQEAVPETSVLVDEAEN